MLSTKIQLCRYWNIIYNTKLYHIVDDIFNHKYLERPWKEKDLYTARKCIHHAPYHSMQYEDIDVPLWN